MTVRFILHYIFPALHPTLLRNLISSMPNTAQILNKSAAIVLYSY